MLPSRAITCKRRTVSWLPTMSLSRIGLYFSSLSIPCLLVNDLSNTSVVHNAFTMAPCSQRLLLVVLLVCYPFGWFERRVDNSGKRKKVRAVFVLGAGLWNRARACIHRVYNIDSSIVSTALLINTTHGLVLVAHWIGCVVETKTSFIVETGFNDPIVYPI